MVNTLQIKPGWRITIAAVALSAAIPWTRAQVAADDATGNRVERLQEIEVEASRVSPMAQTPTDSRLDVLQPQSVINLDYIANSVAPTADFATIANIAPNVSNVETNGPGLSESKHLTLRGFDDAEYNVTFDGIPFGDINDFSHHTTSYFPAKLLGRVVVDRGPGTASDIGYATFGGTIALYSKDPRTDLSFVPTLSFGSWNTRLYHLEVNSGLLAANHDASVIASYQRMSTDGYQTNADMKRDTTYVKYLQPVGRETHLTFLSSYNKIRFNKPGTLTQQQIDTLGRNYGLGSNPNATDYPAYNYQAKQADFEYIGLDTRWGDGWSLDDKVYTYFYNNESHEKAKIKTVAGVPNMLGRFKVNRFRTYGNYLAVTNASAAGVLKAGLWFDYSRNPRYLYSLNYTTLGPDTLDTTATTQWKAVNGNPDTVGIDYQMVDYLRTWQPFVEFEWRVSKSLMVNPGVKYLSFTRVLEAPVNGTSGRLPLFYEHTNTKVIPSIALNYHSDDTWSAYAQIAEGFLGSNLNQFYVDDPTKNTVKPEQTINYQAGAVYKTERLNVDADVYYIDFKNYAYRGPPDANGDPLYWGVAAGARYRGVESQLTYGLGGGWSAYANGAIARAVFKGSKLDVPTVPHRTAALGLMYDRQGFFGSLTGKYVGRWAVYDTLTNPDLPGGGASRRADSDSYWIGDLALGYGRKLDHGFLHSFKIRLQLGNLFNRQVQVLDGIDANPANAYTKDKFNVLPGRNYFLTVSGEF